MNNLITAIFAKAVVGTALYTTVGGRIYLDEAPEATAYPYVVVSIVSEAPDYNFKSTLEDTLIQFSLFSILKSASQISTMYANLKTLYDDCALTITGNTHIWMVRKNLTTMVDDVETTSGTVGLKHWAVDYGIMMEKT